MYEDKYFFHDIKGQGGTIVKKGIAVKDSFEAAQQSYHAYLGAYAYGNEQNTDFVSCMITDHNGTVLMQDAWHGVINAEPAEEPSEE